MTPREIAEAIERELTKPPSPVREAALAMLRLLYDYTLRSERARNWWRALLWIV